MHCTFFFKILYVYMNKYIDKICFSNLRLLKPGCCELMLNFSSRVNQGPDQRRHSRGEAEGRVSYGSVLKNIGKCLLLIIIIPPFLNYASLQKEGQMLLPEGQTWSKYSEFALK